MSEQVLGADDWQQLLAFIEAMHRETGTRFAVSNSRRTPADVSDTLAAAAARKGGAIADFVDVRSAGPGTLGRVFAASEVVLVTTDSSSMLSEAIWLKRPAIAITPAHDALDEAERRYRQRLMDRGLTRTIPIAELTPRTLSAALADLTPLDGNPLDELAGIIAERIPGLFSP